jgi:hypothetical protein
MKRLFIVLVVLVIGVVALGFYRGWFTFDWEKTPDGKGQITGTVDPEKIEEDKKRAAEKVHDLRRPSESGTTEKSKQP